MRKTFKSLLSDLHDCLISLEVTEQHDHGERADKDRILLGSGRSLDVEQQGIALNWKGTSHRSNSELIVRLDDETVLRWRERLSDFERLKGIRVGIEDLGPDTCLSFIFLYLRLNGVDPADFPSEWIGYTNRWEEGDVKTTGAPLESWGCLLSALGHSYWQRVSVSGEPPTRLSEEQVKAGFQACVSFTVGLLLAECHPDRIAYSDARSLEEYHQARALVDYERKVYLQTLKHAKLVQLLMPLRGSSRKTLVDAFIASDLALTGTMKSFIRNDMDHPWTGAGFLLMALYRPSERGTGNDITISVDPSSRITLKELHHEFEVLECERWIARGKHRPYDHPREGFEWNQPWYLEQRNESLIGAPRWLVKGQQLGSELDWQDILDLLWKLYNPARTLQVMPYGTGSTTGEKDCRAIDLCEPTELHGKRFLAVKWMPDNAEQSLVLSPTMKGYLMASVTQRGDRCRPIGIEDLPPELSFDFLMLPGGFALIHGDGAFLMDDWSSQALAVDAYRREFEHAVKRREVLDTVEKSLNRELVQKLSGLRHITDQDIKEMYALVGQRTSLMTTMLETTSRAADLHAAQLRECVEKRFGIASQLDQLYTMLGELEARLRRYTDAQNRVRQLQLLEAQDRDRRVAERFQAFVTGIAAFIIPMTALEHIIKDETEFAKWEPVVFWFASLFGLLVFWFQYIKASADSPTHRQHGDEEFDHLVMEVATHMKAEGKEHSSAAESTRKGNTR